MKKFKFSIKCFGNRKFGIYINAEDKLAAYYEFWKKFINEWTLGSSPIGSNLPNEILCEEVK